MRFVLEPREDLQYVCQSVTVVVASIHSFTFKIAGLLATRASSLTSATCLRRSPLQAGSHVSRTRALLHELLQFRGKILLQRRHNTKYVKYISQSAVFFCLFVCLFVFRQEGTVWVNDKKIQQN